MFGIDSGGSALDPVAHIIQVALTPVFLLSGIATLLNVFSTRLARVADQVQGSASRLKTRTAQEKERCRLSARVEELRREREHVMFAEDEVLERSVAPTIHRLFTRE